jgi:hypothetical protein
MNQNDHRFWPYKTRMSLLLSLVILVLLVIILRFSLGWPSERSETIVLIGALVLSLSPVILALLDIIIERGMAVEIKGIRIDFSKLNAVAIDNFTVSQNIGVPGEPVTDSGTMRILEELRRAVKSDIAIIDLKEGEAWWETRLLLLLSGASRIGQPATIVFVGTEGGKQKTFLGWAPAPSLLACLLRADAMYQRCWLLSKAVARQWELVEPIYPAQNQDTSAPAPPLPWMVGLLSNNHTWMAFNQDGLPNELFAEQYLANELGNMIETRPGGIRRISIQRLEELFRPVLKKKAIDQSATPEQQKERFFAEDASLIAMTNQGQYLGMVSKMAVFNDLFKNLTRKKDA